MDADNRSADHPPFVNPQICDLCGEPADWLFTGSIDHGVILKRFCPTHAQEYLESRKVFYTLDADGEDALV